MTNSWLAWLRLSGSFKVRRLTSGQTGIDEALTLSSSISASSLLSATPISKRPRTSFHRGGRPRAWSSLWVAPRCPFSPLDLEFRGRIKRQRHHHSNSSKSSPWAHNNLSYAKHRQAANPGTLQGTFLEPCRSRKNEVKSARCHASVSGVPTPIQLPSQIFEKRKEKSAAGFSITTTSIATSKNRTGISIQKYPSLRRAQRKPIMNTHQQWLCIEFGSGQQWSPGYAAERGKTNCFGSLAKKCRFSTQINHGMLYLTWLAHQMLSV